MFVGGCTLRVVFVPYGGILVQIRGCIARIQHADHLLSHLLEKRVNVLDGEPRAVQQVLHFRLHQERILGETESQNTSRVANFVIIGAVRVMIVGRRWRLRRMVKLLLAALRLMLERELCRRGHKLRRILSGSAVRR